MYKLKLLIRWLFLVQIYELVSSEIRASPIINKLMKVKPVGGTDKLLALTEIPPPHTILEAHKSGRKHFVDCDEKKKAVIVAEGPHVDIIGDYYDEGMVKIVTEIPIPIHIDHMHFEVTTQVPYLTVGVIEAIGFHPSSPNPNECEKIYLDHLAEQYSDEVLDYSEESLEMARMPLFPNGQTAPKSVELYSDLEAMNFKK